MKLPKLDSLAKGEVGEAYVLYKLLRWDEQALIVTQNNPYDIVVLKDKPIKIQVKASSKTKGRSTLFNVRRGGKHDRYKKGEYDVLALFQLDKERVFFKPFVKLRQVSVNTDLFKRKNEYASWLDTLDKLDI